MQLSVVVLASVTEWTQDWFLLHLKLFGLLAVLEISLHGAAETIVHFMINLVWVFLRGNQFSDVVSYMQLGHRACTFGARSLVVRAFFV